MATLPRPGFPVLADRRAMLGRLACAGALASCGLLSRESLALSSVGRVESSIGTVNAEAGGVTRALASGADIFIGDLVSTSETARLVMLLGAATRVYLGARTRLRVDKFLVAVGGDLRFDSGPLLIDHDEGAPPIKLRARSPFGAIALRGTKVFAGPSNGRFGVFVARGAVDFTAGGVTVRLLAGEGSDVRAPGDKPSKPARWSSERAMDALLSVT